MRFSGRCFRGHDPAWSFDPLSGVGAALVGGRFNRKGQTALYLSLDVITSVIECTQGLVNRLQPLTMCEYDVDCDDLADLRDDAGMADHACDRGQLGCAWLNSQFAGREPASWTVADRLKSSGHSGILVPSFAPGATGSNLVLWDWGPDLPHRVDIYYPNGRLPEDQSSWPAIAARRATRS